MTSDRALVERVLAGDKEAFRALVEKYKDAVFGVAFSGTGHFEDAEEIAQETFLAAFNSLRRLRDTRRFAHWLYGIARNHVRMYLRAAQQRRLAEDRLAQAARRRTAGEAERVSRRRAVVREALRRLPGADREAAALYYIDGYSVADIGRFISRPAGTVKRRLHQARRRLRKELLPMMEGELKRARPGRKFTQAVVRRITGVRVKLSGGMHNFLLLSDSRGRCYEAFLGEYEARAALRGLEGAAPGEPLDIYPATMALLACFGYRAAEVVLSPGRCVPNHLVRLTLLVGRDRKVTVETEFAGLDSVQFAVHCGARILLTDDVAKGWLARRKDGKPMSPAGAWRSILRRRAATFRNVEEVIRALKKDPDSGHAREALPQAVAKGRTDSPLIRDTREGMKKLRAWLAASKGAPSEAVAAGLFGALHLTPLKHPGRARRYLAKAHRLRPEDTRIAFDLATACVQIGQEERALALLRRYRFKDAVRCSNFAKLWPDRRFRDTVGKPDPRYKHLFLVSQLDRSIVSGTHGRKRRDQASVEVARVTQRLRRDLQRLSGAAALLAVQRVVWPLDQGGASESLLLATERRPAAAMRLPEWFDRRSAALWEELHDWRAPWKRRSRGVLNILTGCGVRVEAAVLRNFRAAGGAADVVARKGRRLEKVTMDAFDALALALGARSPILIAKSLAEQLYARGKTGRPLTVTGALRKLRQG